MVCAATEVAGGATEGANPVVVGGVVVTLVSVRGVVTEVVVGAGASAVVGTTAMAGATEVVGGTVVDAATVVVTDAVVVVDPSAAATESELPSLTSTYAVAPSEISSATTVSTNQTATRLAYLITVGKPPGAANP